MDSREALESTTGPGDMNATRHPAAPLSRRLSTDDLCPRMTAKGRKQSFANNRLFHASRVARSTVEN